MKFQVFAIAMVMAIANADQLQSEDPSSRPRNLRAERPRGFEATRNRSSKKEDKIQANKKTEEFVSWASGLGKSYGSTREFETRMNTWRKVDERVKEVNAEADASGDRNAKRLKHNKFSDKTLEEKQKVLGLKIKEDQLSKGRKLADDRDSRNLAVTAGNVDWAVSGEVGGIKDQGYCGSCYTFSANTVLEGTIAKQTGNPYQRLSEQQIVDCGNYEVTQYYYNYGCNGGYMSEVWWFQMDKGAMPDSEYPYVSGTTGSEGSCQDDSSKYVAKVDYWGAVEGGVTNIIEKLQDRPLAVAVAAGNDDWFQYAGGILQLNDCQGQLDHAVVIVGYDAGSNDDGTTPDDDTTPDDGSNPDDGDNGEEDKTVTEIVETTCRKQRWKDRFYETGCRYTDEEVVDDRYCCFETVYITEEVQTLQNSQAFWKIQNSWGSDWGDDGFVYLAVEGDNGVCGMNQWIEWVEPRYD